MGIPQWNGMACGKGLKRNGESMLHIGKLSGASISDFDKYSQLCTHCSPAGTSAGEQ